VIADTVGADLGFVVDGLAGPVLSLRDRELSAAASSEAIDYARLMLLDSIAVSYGARAGAPAVAIRAATGAPATHGAGATEWFAERKTDVHGAVLLNGTMLRYLDFMDIYCKVDACHPSKNFAPLLAVAEDRDLSMADVVRARSPPMPCRPTWQTSSPSTSSAGIT
jgi:2-methylcitrate dehydratase PrpD